MKARLIKKTDINERPTQTGEVQESVVTKVGDVVDWVRESRESISSNRSPNAREKFASLFRQPQTSNG